MDYHNSLNLQRYYFCDPPHHRQLLSRIRPSESAVCIAQARVLRPSAEMDLRQTESFV